MSGEKRADNREEEEDSWNSFPQGLGPERGGDPGGCWPETPERDREEGKWGGGNPPQQLISSLLTHNYHKVFKTPRALNLIFWVSVSPVAQWDQWLSNQL